MCAITADLTRYNYVVAALDETATNSMAHVILRPPTDDKYEHLKAALLSCYDLSDDAAAETRYSSFDRELQAMYLAMRHF